MWPSISYFSISFAIMFFFYIIAAASGVIEVATPAIEGLLSPKNERLFAFNSWALRVKAKT